MKKTFVIIAIVLLATVSGYAVDFSSLTEAQQQTFKDGCLLTAMNIAGAPPSTSQELLANTFLARQAPPYNKLWDMARVLDNSASAPCRTASGTDLAIDSCSISEINAIVAGSFDLLANATHPVPAE